MKIDYALMDPTGNMTVLVETPVPMASQPFCASRLMELEPTAEQVGFLSPGTAGDCDTALRMAGGEFCGNAAMSAAALFCLRRKTAGGTVYVRVSGAEDPVRVTLHRAEGGGFSCEVKMPRPKRVTEYAGCPLVELPGISHMIVTEAMTRDAAEREVKRRCAELDADALGLMLLDEAEDRLTPLVYVPGADTLYWENSCASGTAAVGAYLAGREGRTITRTLAEPAGALGVTAEPAGAPLLRGRVLLRREAFAELTFSTDVEFSTGASSTTTT